MCNFKSLVETSVEVLDVESCREKKYHERNNDAISHSWISSHTLFNDDVSKANMTGQSLYAIDRTTFQSLNKPRTAILNLSVNRISKIEGEVFVGFQNLRILSLHINNLQHINSTTFSGLMMLEELDLSRNMISDFDRDAFRVMINLHTIDLSENCIFKLPNYFFFRNVRLANIYAKHNHLASLPILMPTQQFVKNFNISDNHFTNLTSLMSYNNIQSLDLSNNPLAPEEMASSSTDVAKENNSSDESDDERENYLNIKFATDAKYSFTTSLNGSHSPATSSSLPRRNGNRGRVNFSSQDVNVVSTRRARMNSPNSIENSSHNRSLEYLMDNFRPERMSEEALESLIKSTMEKKSEDFKSTDMIQVLHALINLYSSQDRRAFISSLREIETQRDGMLSIASAVQLLKNMLMTRTTATKMRRSKRSKYTPEQLQRLIKAARTNHLEYFTCRNCSLQSLDFLLSYPELKHIDVTGNKIKIVNEQKLGKTLHNIRYLVVSDNEIESLNFTSMLSIWPDFCALIANNNPLLNCDLIAGMEYKVAHLNKMFKLEVNKCK